MAVQAGCLPESREAQVARTALGQGNNKWLLSDPKRQLRVTMSQSRLLPLCLGRQTRCLPVTPWVVLVTILEGTSVF